MNIHDLVLLLVSITVTPLVESLSLPLPLPLPLSQISQEDIDNIIYLCDQVTEISNYRAQLYDYLKNRYKTRGIWSLA